MAKYFLKVRVAQAVSRKDNGLSISFVKPYKSVWKSARKALNSPECEAAFEAFNEMQGCVVCLCHFVFEFFDEEGKVVQTLDVMIDGYSHGGGYDPDIREKAKELEWIANSEK